MSVLFEESFCVAGGLVMALYAVAGGFPPIIPSLYAEPIILGSFWKRPWNAGVNVVYWSVSGCWLWWLEEPGNASPQTKRVLVPFHILNFLYGGVQFARITTEVHADVVVDRLLAFPFFSWVALASLAPNKCNSWTFISTFVPGLVYLVFPIDEVFNALFVAHFAAVLIATSIAPRPRGRAWMLALFSCLGFIFFKVYDLELGRMHPVFTRISGHFLSKICDGLQAHFISLFLLPHF